MSFEKPGPVEENWRDAISSIEEILEDARNGRMFILVDHEDRENEGDLVIPAQMATPEAQKSWCYRYRLDHMLNGASLKSCG